MKKFILFACFIFNFFFAGAQQLDWIDTVYLSEYNSAPGIVKDLSGNVYVSGRFSRNYSGSTATNGSGVFLRKYTSSGVLLWTENSSSGTVGTLNGGVVTDVAGNVYATFYIGTSYSTPAITFGSTTYYGGNKMYFVKYNPNGQVVWVIPHNGCEPRGITIDNTGYIYLAGIYNGYVMKYDTSGTCLLNIPTAAYDIAVNNNGDIFIVYQNHVKKYAASGSLIWSVSIPHAVKIAADNAGNCYVTCDYQYYGQTSLKKINSAGQLLWTVNANNGENGSAITVDSTGSFIYTAGEYVVNQTAGGMAITKYDSSGNQIWYYLHPNDINSSDGYQTTKVINSGNEVYVTAYSYWIGIIFLKLSDPLSTSVSAPTLSSPDLSVFPNPSNKLVSVSYKSNLPADSKLSLKVYDISGKCMLQKFYNNFNGELNDQLDLGFCTPGIYTLEIISSKRKAQKKIVLQ